MVNERSGLLYFIEVAKFESTMLGLKEYLDNNIKFKFFFKYSTYDNRIIVVSDGTYLEAPLTHVLNHIIEKGKITYTDFEALSDKTF